MWSNVREVAPENVKSSGEPVRRPPLLDCTACARIIGAFALFVST